MDAAANSLLGPSDPAPVELVREEGRAPLVLTCEHGGRAVPSALAWGRPPDEDMARHIAYDVGAAQVARRLADRLDAALALQPYSRLVIDGNRPRSARDLVPAISDGTPVPFNRHLDADGLETRWQAIHQPFHGTVAGLLDRRPAAALIAVHSFTRQLRGQPPRAMAIGLIARQDKALSNALREAITHRRSDLPIAFDAPYQIEDHSDYTIPVHAEPRRRPHLLLEIRNDLITRDEDAAHMGDLLAWAIEAALPAVTDGNRRLP